MDKFPCTSCGACCRLAYLFGDTVPLDENGACAHLEEQQQDGRKTWICSIYEDRPNICQINKNLPKDMTVQTHYELNAWACNTFQEQEGLDTSYRVAYPPDE